MSDGRPFNPAQDLIVVAAHKAPDEIVARAQTRAHELGGRWVRRDRGIATLLKRHSARLAYVVTHEREAIQTGDATLFMHPGLFYLKEGDGPSHPLIRAISPPGCAPVKTLLDGTLGLAGDALHIAAVTGARITGVEASPILAALAREGLKRVGAARRRWAEPAAAITPQQGQAVEVLDRLESASVDVVYLDPMFRTPLGAQPGFDLLRMVAEACQPDAALLLAAARVARRRVVVKVAGAAPPPKAAPPDPGWNRWVRGAAVDYYVLEKEAAAFDSDGPPSKH